MPHYVPKYLPQSGYVVDAERIMQELERASEVLGRLDQHALEIDSILPTRFRAPSSEGDTYLQAFNGGSLLADTGASFALSNVSGRERWQEITGLEVEVVLARTHYLHMEVSAEVQADGSSGNLPAWVDVQITLDGERTSASATCFFTATNAIQTVYAQDSVLVQPGTHTVKVRARVREGEAADVTQSLVIVRGTVA